MTRPMIEHGFTSRLFYRKSMICSLLFMLISGIALAQTNEIKVRAGFFSDSVKLGESTAFYLSARYPSKVNILFPDSTFTFAPFEFQSKKYFPTQTISDVSTDSVIYYLSTFEVDSIQSLDLPVFVIHEKDCTVYQSNRDSIRLIELVSLVPDSLTADKLPLKMNTAYQRVFFQFNFVVLLIIVFSLIVVIVLAWILFGKKIRRYFKTKKLERNHLKFLEAYSKALQELKSVFSVMTAESTLFLWKKYMEQLESWPYTKLTTRETIMIEKDRNLEQNLRTIDNSIYGHNASVVTPFEDLRAYAEKRYQQKLKEVTYGRK